MPRVVPTQAVATIDLLFPHVKGGETQATYTTGNAPSLRGIVDLVREIPPELLALPSDEYANFVIGLGAIENQLATWASRGDTGALRPVSGLDPLAHVRRALVKCPDEFPPPETTTLTFITDPDTRASLSRDVSSAGRAFVNLEWKAATVLGGATIEALLHWRLSQAPPDEKAIRASAAKLHSCGTFTKKPSPDRDDWSLHHFIEIAADLKLIESDTLKAAALAKDFRNLVHPGRAARKGLICDRATALSALAGLEHVIRDLS